MESEAGLRLLAVKMSGDGVLECREVGQWKPKLAVPQNQVWGGSLEGFAGGVGVQGLIVSDFLGHLVSDNSFLKCYKC